MFGQLYRWLLEPGNRSDHGAIKQLLRNYIVQNMDVCVGRNLLGERIERRRKYSVQSLALQSGLHPQTLGKVLVERRLIAAENAGKPASILLIDADEGCQAAASLRRSVPFMRLRALLGATRPIASCLIELGILTPLTRSQGENTRDKCGFDALEVEQVLDRVHVMASEMSDLPAEWVTLTQCSKRARIPMRDLLQIILSGKIRQIGRAQGEVGFNSLRISIEEIRLLAS